MFSRGRRKDVINIGGRAYVPVGPLSFRHDEASVALAIELGFFDQPTGGEDVDDFTRRQILRINGSGRVSEILGYIVMPEGTAPEKWTKKLAADTSDALCRVTSDADKDRVHGLLQQGILFFFQIARRFSKSLPTSSTGTQILPSGLANLTAAVRSESGAPWSAN